MKSFATIILLLVISCGVYSQKYYTKSGNISFYSDAPLEKIEAHNNNATAVLDMETGAIEWAVLIKGFEFEKSLMQEHFNENYMESSKFPKSIFKGKFREWKPFSTAQNGMYEITLEGTLTIHGVSNNVIVPITFSVTNETLAGEAKFSVLVADYNINIPGIVRDKIAKEVEIIVEADLQLLEAK